MLWHCKFPPVGSSLLLTTNSVIMGANIAGIYGAQIFRADDSPRYRRAFSIGAAIIAFGLCLAIFRFVDDKLKRRRNKNVSNVATSDSDDASQIEKSGFQTPPSADLPPPVIIDGARRPSASHALKAVS